MTNKKSTKRAFLMSVLSLVLCISMLAGTTFAWFTDSVSSENNIITAGNLDIELYWSTNAKDWTKVDGNTNIFKDNTLWEPGHTEVVYLKVVNEGSLALKYQLGVNIVEEIEGVNQQGNPFKLSNYIEFGVEETDKAISYGTRQEALAAVEDSLKIISAGYSKSSELYPKDNMSSLPAEEYAALVVTMPEDVSNDANHNGVNVPSIKLGLNLFATQLGYEQDSFGSDYDAKASITVQPGESIADAIKNVEDGGIVYLLNGEHNVGSVVTVSGKTVSIVGVGEVTLQNTTTHFFNVANGSNVTFENLTMLNAAKHGVYVRNNATVTMKDVVIKGSKGSADIMVDEASDAAHGLNTASYVWLYDSEVDRVALCASPVTSVAATQDTYVYFNYDAKSSVGSIEKQGINLKPENIFINGVNDEANGMNLYVTNDAELAAALNTIKTNSKYWNTQVYVHMAAGTYSADHVINQYPQWNGVVGAGGSGNNYASGVPAGAPGTVITFVGETATTYGLRAATTPTVVFTGNVTINGFGNAGSGFDTATAVTTFQNIAFDAANSVEANNEDYIVMYVKAGANNVNFDGCTFLNATHVTLGNNASDGAGTVNVTGCTFNDGGCLAGYVATLNVSDCVVTKASNGFLDKKKAGPLTVENCEVVCDVYFLRTDNADITVEVTDTTVKQTDVPNPKGTGLVVFRGSGHSVDFTDCDLTYDTLKGGTGSGEMNIYTYTETDGVTYYSEAISGENVLYLVPADYAGETVNVAEGTTTIGNYAFAYNSNVKTVNLPSTVRDLGRGFDSSSVEKVVLNEGLTTISSRAFRSTTALKEVVIPSTVTEIADNAFQKSAIKEIVIPANVKTVGETAFGASLIEKVTFEGDIAIQGYAFRGCTKLHTVIMKGYDVTFVPSTLNGRNSTWFCNNESNNPNTSDIDFYVKNEVIKERVLTAMGAERNNTDVYCEINGTQEGGYITDEADNMYVYNSDALIAAINDAKDGDTIFVATGDYALRFTNDTTFNVDNLTIVGMGDVNLAISSSEVWYGRVQGDNVTFENVNFASTVGTTGKVTYNNCTFADWTICASSNYKETYFNNCKIAILNTSTDFSSGDAFLKECEITKAEYSGSKSMNFDNCQIGEMIIWNMDTTLNGCTVETLDLSHVTDAVIKVDGLRVAASGEALKAALLAGEKTIGIASGITLTESLGATDVTFIGVVENAGINFNGYNIGGSGSITYKNLDLTTVSLPYAPENGERYGWYGGIDYNGHSVANYENCNISGVFTTYSPVVNVTDCTFDYYVQDGEEYYNIFMYAACKLTATRCTFTYGDRAIKAYSEGFNQYELILNECKFVADENYELKKALINVSNGNLTLSVTNNTVDEVLQTLDFYATEGSATVTVK